MELGSPESLKQQFNNRLIYVLMNVVGDERASQNDWFDAPAPEEIDEEAFNEAVTVDMLAISEKFLPNFKFKEEVEKGFVNTTEMKRSKRRVFIKSHVLFFFSKKGWISDIHVHFVLGVSLG